MAYDSNRYSVDSERSGGRRCSEHMRTGSSVVHDGVVIGEHPRLFGRHETSYDPWHYIPVLQRKPGALSNGAPFKDWELPRRCSGMREALGSKV